MARWGILTRCWDWHLPDTDDVVAVAGEQGLSIGRPGEWQTLRWVGFWGLRNDFGAKLFDGFLACQIPDFDRWTISDAQPVAVWWEAQSIDAVVVIQSVQVLAVIQVPQQSLCVFTTWCAQWTVRRNGDGVQVAIVSFVVDLELAVSQIPDFDGTIPAAWYDDWVAVVWRETNAWDPVRVAFVLDCVFAFGQSVPQFDGLVTRARNDLTIVNAECNR